MSTYDIVIVNDAATGTESNNYIGGKDGVKTLENDQLRINVSVIDLRLTPTKQLKAITTRSFPRSHAALRVAS